jgi:hypothetical protein
VMITINQFYATLDGGLKLVLVDHQPFAILRPILNNIVESIRHLGGDNRAEPFAAKVIELGNEIDHLRQLEATDTGTIINESMTNLRLNHARALEEARLQKEEAEKHYDQAVTTYQESVATFQVSQVAAQAAGVVIAHCQEVIRKAQATILENERIMAMEQKKMEDLSVQNENLYNGLQGLFSRVETAMANHSQQAAVTDEELHRMALESAQADHLKKIGDVKEKI